MRRLLFSDGVEPAYPLEAYRWDQALVNFLGLQFCTVTVSLERISYERFASLLKGGLNRQLLLSRMEIQASTGEYYNFDVLVH